MPYIPDARMDRVKKRKEIFTLKYFAQIINLLNFEQVEVLDPHSDVSAALFNKVHVGTPNRMIETAVKKIASNNLMMFYPDAGSMKDILQQYIFHMLSVLRIEIGKQERLKV